MIADEAHRSQSDLIEGLIRQFVALPLGAGDSVEEQLTGRADVGGMQLPVAPLSAEGCYRHEAETAGDREPDPSATRLPAKE